MSICLKDNAMGICLQLQSSRNSPRAEQAYFYGVNLGNSI